MPHTLTTKIKLLCGVSLLAVLANSPTSAEPVPDTLETTQLIAVAQAPTRSKRLNTSRSPQLTRKLAKPPAHVQARFRHTGSWQNLSAKPGRQKLRRVEGPALRKRALGGVDTSLRRAGKRRGRALVNKPTVLILDEPSAVRKRGYGVKPGNAVRPGTTGATTGEYVSTIDMTTVHGGNGN